MFATMQGKEKILGPQLRLRKGHSLFSFNIISGEIKQVELKRDENKKLLPVQMEEHCMYLTALNKENAVWPLVRDGILL